MIRDRSRIGWNRTGPGGVEPLVKAAELAGWLATHGVPDGTVRVAAEVDRTWCLRAVGAGAQGWEVFWCEDGGRYEWTRFDDESAACFHLFGRLVWASAAGGAP